MLDKLSTTKLQPQPAFLYSFLLLMSVSFWNSDFQVLTLKVVAAGDGSLEGI